MRNNNVEREPLGWVSRNAKKHGSRKTVAGGVGVEATFLYYLSTKRPEMHQIFRNQRKFNFLTRAKF